MRKCFFIVLQNLILASVLDLPTTKPHLNAGWTQYIFHLTEVNQKGNLILKCSNVSKLFNPFKKRTCYNYGSIPNIFYVYKLFMSRHCSLQVKNIDIKQSNKRNNQNSKDKRQDNHMK